MDDRSGASAVRSSDWLSGNLYDWNLNSWQTLGELLAGQRADKAKVGRWERAWCNQLTRISRRPDA